jgi:hypothetical protein
MRKHHLRDLEVDGEYIKIDTKKIRRQNVELD